MNILKRTEKIALLSSLITGTATPTQIENLRKSKEPIHVTLVLNEDVANQQPQYPSYHIVIRDGISRAYWKYEDGSIIEQTT